MPDYRETTAEATSYRRAFAVHLNNPLGGVGRGIGYEEEDVINIVDRTVKTPAGGLSAPFDPAQTFALLNPLTGAPTGATASHLDVYVLLNSLYIDLALKRDAAALTALAPISPPDAPAPVPSPASAPEAAP